MKALLLSLLAPLTLLAASPEPYDVVWDSPSADHHGSMPLGNGDLALNAWMTPDGDLHFYISKTDAWDDNGRLLKVGKVRVHFEPALVEPGRPFRQELRLRDGGLEITTGGEGAVSSSATRSSPSVVRLWVDANHPVIQMTADTARPVEATAFVELWRTKRQELTELQTSDVLLNRKRADGRPEPMVIEPDTVLAELPNRIGWFHHNTKSVGPELMAQLQGLTGFKQADPLLHRTFGAVVTAASGERLDDRRLRSPRKTQHRFSVYVLTRHPSTPERWLADMNDTIRRVEAQNFATRRKAHLRWWAGFWDRSWIRATANAPSAPASAVAIPANKLPIRIGLDQGGGNVFAGELGRVSLFTKPLAEAQIAALAKLDQTQSPAASSDLAFSGLNLKPHALADSAAMTFASGLTIECWVKPAKLPEGGARLVDKITPGSSDGFLLDTFPGNSLRFICGEDILQQDNALPADRWTHVAVVVEPGAEACRVFVNGALRLVAGAPGGGVRDEAALVSQKYHLQRFITACAGRGAYPIKFNGSLFTVPPGPKADDPDYRRWGPGYWWQNTRLPYISLATTGDFDLLRPLFHMYADELLPIAKYRTRHYLGHGGAYYPECIYFWGAVFSETYGWTPFEQRTDKLQESGWHKWEWVGGLELGWMMLDYWEHTQDRAFLRQTALPFTREILTFFDQHYPTNAQGQLVMHPSQALETWWRCTNAMPELAGCRAVTERLLALPARDAPAMERAFWQRLHAKLPALPVRTVDGRTALAPAETFAQKSNIENPELYAVFPFRLIALGKPNLDWGVEALEHRWDRGNSGWRQDDIFMAYLGLTDQARQSVVGRAKAYDRNERFPAFWGPNYDWTPDQDHGGVLMKAVQSMLMQTEGRRILLLPAWPMEWDVDFKLHAPYQTVVEGVYRNGTMQSLHVTPAARRKDVEFMAPRR